jgi:hypothetical protein
LTQPKTLQNVAYARFAPNCEGSVKIGRLGQKRIGANKLAWQIIAQSRHSGCVGFSFVPPSAERTLRVGVHQNYTPSSRTFGLNG